MDLTTNEKVIEHRGPIKMALLRRGMKSGRANVTIRLDMSDGSIVLTQISLTLLLSVAKAMAAAPDVIL